MNNFAHLKEDSPFYPLFEHGMVPILNWLVGEQGNCIGDGVKELYRVDVSKLTPSQREQIASMVALKCGGTPNEVKAEMDSCGFIPLRALHVCYTSSDSMAFL